MLYHGVPKLFSFTSRWHNFSNPIGLGPELSFTLVVFAEFFCAVFLIAGAFTRLVLMPLIIEMIVIVFMVHGKDPFPRKELAVFFLVAYASLFLTGPGKYSIDGMRR